jgi:hypothetical protein
MTRTILILLFGLLVAACAAQYRWYKEGAAKAEVDAAREDCKAEARAYGFLDASQRSARVPTARGERYTSITVTTATREADIFNECMRAKGFALVPEKE